MDQFSLRAISRNDNPALATIIRSVLAEFKANKPGTVYYDPTTDDLFSLFNNEKAMYWVAWIKDEIVGGGGIYPTENLPDACCELVKLYLSPNARGRGLGKVLIEKCFETAIHYGYKQIYLETMPELRSAMGLYEKCGFTYLPGALGNSGHFGCDLWMLKQLQKEIPTS